MECQGVTTCPGSKQRGRSSFTKDEPCTWTRKLCVSCFKADQNESKDDDDDDDVYIRVQGNGLPNHCYDGVFDHSPEPFDMDW